MAESDVTVNVAYLVRGPELRKTLTPAVEGSLDNERWVIGVTEDRTALVMEWRDRQFTLPLGDFVEVGAKVIAAEIETGGQDHGGGTEGHA